MNKNTKTNRKGKNGFTLIELIVVMAILGVLVLLAAPRFLGYTKKADVKRIQNDTKVVEQLTEEYLMAHEDLTGWEAFEKQDIEALAQEGMLYEIEGLASTVSDGEYFLLNEGILDKSNTGLKGNFYANSKGKVYYQDENAADISEDGNLILNGSFVTNSLRAWEPSAAVVEQVDGKTVAVVSDTDALVQTVNVPAAGVYELSFDTKAEADGTEVMISYEYGSAITIIDENSMVAASKAGGINKPITTGWDTYTLPIEIDEAGKMNIEVKTVAGKARVTKLKLVYGKEIVAIPQEPAIQYTDEKWFIFDAITQTITGYSIDGPKNVVIPKQIGVTTVLKIRASAFYQKGLTSAIIPETVVSIGGQAFAGNSISTLILPENVSISRSAFALNELKKLTIPRGTIFTDTYAFAANPINELYLPNGITVITGTFIHPVDYAGEGMYSVQNGKYVPVTTIVDMSDNSRFFTFNSDTGIITNYSPAGPKEVIVPMEIGGKPVLSIGSGSPAGGPYYYTPFAGDSRGGITSLTILAKITQIPKYSMYNPNLTTLTLPDGVFIVSPALDNPINYTGAGTYVIVSGTWQKQ